MKIFYRRHLPHWQPQDAVFFVTFRLKNSLPYEIIESLREERERAKVSLNTLLEYERTHQNTLDDQRYFERWEEYLNRADFGPRWLSQPEIAGIVKEALHYRDGKVFDLHAYCIVSNHVHVVFEPLSRSEWHSDLQHSNPMPRTKSCNRSNATLHGRQILFLAGKVLFGRMKVMIARFGIMKNVSVP